MSECSDGTILVFLWPKPRYHSDNYVAVVIIGHYRVAVDRCGLSISLHIDAVFYHGYIISAYVLSKEFGSFFRNGNNSAVLAVHPAIDGAKIPFAATPIRCAVFGGEE